MLSPNLVESQVKHILHYNLVSCHDMKMKTFSFLFYIINTKDNKTNKQKNSKKIKKEIIFYII